MEKDEIRLRAMREIVEFFRTHGQSEQPRTLARGMVTPKSTSYMTCEMLLLFGVCTTAVAAYFCKDDLVRLGSTALSLKK